MSLKKELETWSSALQAYEAKNLSLAISELEKIADTAKICWNIGLIMATMGKHEEAVERFGQAVALDSFLTIGWWQRGVSYFMLGKYVPALDDFEAALLYMRGNTTINYTQLGLAFQLYSAEVLFNIGLTKIYLGDMVTGLRDLREASGQKQVEEHSVIDDAIRDGGRDYNVFSVPVGTLFKPSASKMKNLEARDYMGKAVLIANTNPLEAYTTFTGITRLQRGQTPTGARLDPGYRTHLARSASVNDIPLPPLSAMRMGRSHTVTAKPIIPIDRTGTPDRAIQYTDIVPPGESSILRIANPTPSSSSPAQEHLQAPVTRPRPQLPRIQTKGLEQKKMRVTEVYEDYYRSPEEYGDEEGIAGGTIEAWTKSGGMLEYGGGRIRRQDRQEREVPQGVPVSVGLDDELEPEVQVAKNSVFGMSKIRVKSVSIRPSQTLASFFDAVKAKFPDLGEGLCIRFKDEDGDMLDLVDKSDFEAAIDVARIMARGRGAGKLEIWVA